MSRSSSKNIVIWMLVVGVFSGLVVFWFPSFFHTIQTLAGEVGKNADTSTATLKTEWSLTQEQLDTLGKTLASATQTSPTLSKTQMESFAKEVDAQAVIIKDPAAFPLHEDTASIASTDTDPSRTFCTRNGGRAVQRTQKNADYNVCIFKDGTECETHSFVDGLCRAGMYRKAEDGIKKVADLVLEVKKAGYCIARTSPISWTDDASVAYICLDGVTIKNNGWGNAAASSIRTAGKYYAVPALAAGDHYTFSDPFPFVKAKINNQAVIVVDAKNNVKESNEDNNIYTFPQ